MDYKVYVISAGRYDALPFNEKQKQNYIFCVKTGEGNLYKAAGCFNVYETGKLLESRNWALDHADKNGLICVELSDDIKSVKTNSNYFIKEVVNLDEAIGDMVSYFIKTKMKLMGIAPTANDFYANKLISINTFCIGDLFFVKPGSGIRFDSNLTLKEDYDFTLSFLDRWRQCFRYQKYMFEFKHYSNKGGAVDYRNDCEEQKNIAYLMHKWGGEIIRLNKRRENEILIKWKKDKKLK